MPAQETVAAQAPVAPIKALLTDVSLRHGSNHVNVNNNRGFAMLDGQLVEVVRLGKNESRIRRSLANNGDTEKVATNLLTEYTHPVKQWPAT